jgi:hypothetical protein
MTAAPPCEAGGRTTCGGGRTSGVMMFHVGDDGGPEDLRDELAVLLAFLGRKPLTTAVRHLERALDGCHGKAAAEEVAAAGIDATLLAAAVATRRQLGRLNDLIHASAIGLMLPRLLEPDEVVQGRPSLAAGNDPARPYDLQTDRRVAEFKLSYWAGADAMRKRGVFKDLVHLAADQSGRRAQLFVLGEAPIKFLTRPSPVHASSVSATFRAADDPDPRLHRGTGCAR